MRLVAWIAWTHVRSRLRQTGVAVAGVATGVGFSIMMAALMQGSQDDFIRQLVNALPHITVTDERRSPPRQPAEKRFAAVEIHGLTPEARRPDRKRIAGGGRTLMPGLIDAHTHIADLAAALPQETRRYVPAISGADPRGQEP